MISTAHRQRELPGDLALSSGGPSKQDKVGYDQAVRYLLRHRLREMVRKGKRILETAEPLPVEPAGTDLPGQIQLEDSLD